MNRLYVALLLFATHLWLAPISLAHKASDSYLSLRADGSAISGQWDIALRDLDLILNLDRNADRAIDWGEVRTRHAEIATYALRHLRVSQSGSPCTLQATNHMIDEHSDGVYAVIQLSGHCEEASEQLTIEYTLLFDVDAQHRGLVKLHSPDTDAKIQTAVFPSENRVQRFSLSSALGADNRSAVAQFITYVADGVKHIAIGFDHILFLIALLLPAVLVRRNKIWEPVCDLRSALWNVFKIVTAFTIAHSITLSLAALNVVQLPSRLVESVIAASVVLTAVDNVHPFLPRRRWWIAFAFGLVHGFGFANVLADLNLPATALVISLLGFNIGVEIGQLSIVFVLVPLAYISRRSWGYSRIVLGAGSLTIAAISLGWFIERSLNVQLMPF